MEAPELFKNVERHFAPILEAKSVKKGTLLHKEQTVNYSLYLVKNGILRSFYFIEGRDVTAHFALQNGIIGAADSIIKDKRSRYNIEALEDSEVYAMDYRKLEAFLGNNPSLERLARIFSQHLYIDLIERLEGMTFVSAQERYSQLIERYPKIDQHVNLGHIASYLGISQETLSRVRSAR